MSARGKVTSKQFEALAVLLDSADRRTGIADMSHAELARRAGCQERAAQKATKRFEELDLADVERAKIGKRANGSPVYGGGGGTNRYHFVKKKTSDATRRERTQVRQRTSGKAKENVPVDDHTLSLDSYPKDLLPSHRYMQTLITGLP